MIIPTYNEAENIEAIVGRVRAAVPEAHILVADDNSPDGTGKLADELAAERRPRPRPAPQGQGRARRRLPRGLPLGPGARLRRPRRDGRRRLPPARGTAPPAHRARAAPTWSSAPAGCRAAASSTGPSAASSSRAAAARYSRLLLDVPIRDVTGGYRAFRRETLEGLGLDEVASAGLLLPGRPGPPRGAEAGYHVVEVPITFVERELGDTKMSRDIVVEALWRVTPWGVGDRAAKLLGQGAGKAPADRPTRRP